MLRTGTGAGQRRASASGLGPRPSAFSIGPVPTPRTHAGRFAWDTHACHRSKRQSSHPTGRRCGYGRPRRGSGGDRSRGGRVWTGTWKRGHEYEFYPLYIHKYVHRTVHVLLGQTGASRSASCIRQRAQLRVLRFSAAAATAHARRCRRRSSCGEYSTPGGRRAAQWFPRRQASPCELERENYGALEF